MIKRIIYFGYYIKNLDLKLYRKFLDFASIKSATPKRQIILDSVFSTFKYNISLLEYFQFRFFLNKAREYRSTWAGTGTMYEYQLLKNPEKKRHILDDKLIFGKKYQQFVKYNSYSFEELKKNSSIWNDLKNNLKLVFKDSHGKCGISVRITNSNNFDTVESLINYMKANEVDMVEPFIIQHPELNRLSPSGVNTIRIITDIDKSGNLNILGCRLRISIDNYVDNLAAGNIAAPINVDSGKVSGLGVYSDITKDSCEVHPKTGETVIGFQIPFWKETLDLVKDAAAYDTSNKSIGWDVVVSIDGPMIIEGNHDWCKLLWQLPVGKGLKPLLNE